MPHAHCRRSHLWNNDAVWLARAASIDVHLQRDNSSVYTYTYDYGNNEKGLLTSSIELTSLEVADLSVQMPHVYRRKTYTYFSIKDSIHYHNLPTTMTIRLLADLLPHVRVRELISKSLRVGATGVVHTVPLKP
jgi:hypothetical protein